MNECAGRKFILNGDLQPCDIFDKTLVYEGDSVYEVLRLVNGNPIFFNDHMVRLAASARLQNKKILADPDELKNAVKSLAKSQKKPETNIKIVFNYKNEASNYLVYFIESVYPTEMQYKKGVKGILFLAERNNPESKVINHKLRSAIYHKLISESAYEAILVNENDFITEGSRSNIFFLKKETLYTAPDNMILNGITRKRILEICKENNIRVVLECVKAGEIKNFDSAFMTGTSPMVLPFSRIDDTYFNVESPLIEKLRRLYLERAEESISLFTS